MENEELKHLEFVQNVITRMNTNSFQIKGWAVTIVSATLALYASTKNEYFVLVGIFPAVIFWFLDAYYLLQERKFRGIYNDVSGVSKEPITTTTFEMRPDRYTRKVHKKYGYGNVFRSTTIANLYFAVVTMLVVLFVCLYLFVRS